MNKKSNNVFLISLAIVLVIVLFGVFIPTKFEAVANLVYSFLSGNFGWLYLLSMTSFVVFSIWIALSKYGSIKLGADDSEPDYGFVSWFAMLFSAGMGIGLVFWGVAEPLNHFVNPLSLESGSAAAADFAIRKSFLHWGLHPWANYSVLALSLAYMQFRKNKPGLISSIFIPLIGEKRVAGPIGQFIDILAIFATVAGIATSLGLGAMQINSGLNYLFGFPETKLSIILIVVVVTVIFMFSSAAGLDKGMKFLSNLNVAMAGVIVVLAIAVGPTLLTINNFTNGLGLYLSNIVGDSFAIDNSTPWYGSWTISYWAWWIAWAPFVGTFIARISKGRTIKEFVMGVLIAPTFASLVWFTVFGTLGINAGIEVATEAITSTSTAFFVIAAQYPLGMIMSILAVFLLCTFFITSADSATFVLSMLSSQGDLNPSTKKKIIWGVIQSSLALVLMLAGANGLKMLQTVSIVAAFPFTFVMLLSMVSIVKGLKEEDIDAINASNKNIKKNLKSLKNSKIS